MKNNKWFQHEGLDRTHMLLVQLEEAFYTINGKDEHHPSIHNKRCKKLLSKATITLADLYQAIGEWEK